MKRTLLISEIFPPRNGGSGRWFWDIYSRLSSDSYFIATGSCDGASEFDRKQLHSIQRLNLSSRYWGILDWRGIAFYLSSFFKLKKIVKENGIGIVHLGRCLPEGVFGLVFKKLMGIPYLCYIHGEDIETARASREHVWIIKSVLCNADLLVCNSYNTKAALLNDWGVTEKTVEVLHPGTDAKKFVPGQREAKEREDMGWGSRPVIMTVGRLQKRKGHDKMIEALRSIKDKFPNVLYAIIGDGEERSTLEELVSKWGLEGNVRFLNEISDDEMLKCYQQATMFILPNRTVDRDVEGFGIVLLEAQACELPVIAGDSGGTSETMKVGVSGNIIDCSDPVLIAEQVCALLGDEKLRKKMGKEGRRHVLENLDWDVLLKKTETIFGRLN